MANNIFFLLNHELNRINRQRYQCTILSNCNANQNAKMQSKNWFKLLKK